MPTTDIDWMDAAACAGQPEIFDMATLLYDVDAAREICVRCPVIDQCRAYSDAKEHCGDGYPGYADMIVAGETPRERWVRRTGRAVKPHRTSDRIRALGGNDPWVNLRKPEPPRIRKPDVPWQEAGGLRVLDPRSLMGHEAGFVLTQVVWLTGLTDRQVRYLAQCGVAGILGGRSGRAGRWSVIDIDRLRFIKDRLDEGASMQGAKRVLMAVSV